MDQASPKGKMGQDYWYLKQQLRCILSAAGQREGGGY